MSNYQSLFHVISLKLDMEPSLVYCQHGAFSAASNRSGLLQDDAQWSIVMNIYAQVAGGTYCRRVE